MPVMATRGEGDDMRPYNTAAMSRAFAITGGLLFVGSLVFSLVSYAWRFNGGAVPWSAPAAWSAGLMNAALFSVFALHHSLLARAGAREWVAGRVSPRLERSVYVWIASLLFLLVCLLWRPVPGTAWHLHGVVAGAFALLQALGAVLTVAAARRIGPLELAGVAPPRARHAGQSTALDRGPYRIVRHPIYLGWFLMVWCSPVMNGTRLTFAALSCVYLLLAIPFEERDLRRTFGADYEAYARRVAWKILPGIH